MPEFYAVPYPTTQGPGVIHPRRSRTSEHSERVVEPCGQPQELIVSRLEPLPLHVERRTNTGGAGTDRDRSAVHTKLSHFRPLREPSPWYHSPASNNRHRGTLYATVTRWLRHATLVASPSAWTRRSRSTRRRPAPSSLLRPPVSTILFLLRFPDFSVLECSRMYHSVAGG